MTEVNLTNTQSQAVAEASEEPVRADAELIQYGSYSMATSRAELGRA